MLPEDQYNLVSGLNVSHNALWKIKKMGDFRCRVRLETFYVHNVWNIIVFPIQMHLKWSIWFEICNHKDLIKEKKTNFFYFASKCWKGIDWFVLFPCRNPSYQTGGGWNRGRQLKKNNLSLFIHPTIFHHVSSWGSRVSPSCLSTGRQLINGPRQTTVLSPRPVWSSRLHPVGCGFQNTRRERANSTQKAPVVLGDSACCPSWNHSTQSGPELTFDYKQAQHQN